MRGENGRRDGEREGAPRPRPAVPYAAVHEEQHQRQQRGDEQLAIVPGRHETGHIPADHVRHAGDERAVEAEADGPAQKQEGEATGEEHVQDEPPRHCRVGRQEHPEEHGRRVEQVAGHGADVRDAAHQVRVPERRLPLRADRVFGELAERIPGEVLVA